jgi:large subunit ribosomal protein L10
MTGSTANGKSKVKRDKMTAHVSEFKKQQVADIKSLMAKYPIVAVLNLENLPARQLQKMKTKLRKEVEIKMAKKPVIKQAFKESDKPNIALLEKYLSGMPALLLTKENPFKLYKIIKKSKSAAAIKPGQQTPKDIMIPAGPTPFAPGPIIGELGMLKIKAGIEGGKVVIKQDAHVAQKGDTVNAQLSSLLMRLGIEPMEIGLDLVAVYEKGEILTKDVLDIDESAYIAKIQTAATESMNLAVDIAYASKDTILLLIQKSFRDSRALAVERDILADAVIDQILMKADAQANALKELTDK